MSDGRAMTQIAPHVYGGPFLAGLDLPSEIARIEADDDGLAPGMVSREEAAMLIRLVAQTWRGEGAIIDGGSFFGSSLVAEAQGLRSSPALGSLDLLSFPQGKPIHGYELGFLPGPSDPKVDRRRVYGGVEYFLGDDFVPILERTIAPYRRHIELHLGDLNQERWSGSPIEIAFIDVCKTMQLNAHVSREFYPSMIPGDSTLIHQDYFFDRLPWIRVTMGFLRDYFRWEGQVQTSSVYRSVKAVPPEVAAHDPFIEGTYDDCLRYHDATPFDEVSRVAEFRLAVSRGYLMAQKGRRREALDYLRSLDQEFADAIDDEETGADAKSRLQRAVSQIGSGMIFAIWGWSGVAETVGDRPTALPMLGDAATGTVRLAKVDLRRGLARVRANEQIAGRISSPELALVAELAAHTWEGAGAVVNTGCFLGSAVVAAADGLSSNPALATSDRGQFSAGRPVHGFDVGSMPAPASPLAARERRFGDVTYQLGDSYVPRLRRAVASHADLVKLHIGDLRHARWNGHAIELAIVDGCTTPEVTAHVVRTFLPALVGGASRLVVRDFYADQLPWLNVAMGHLAPYFRWDGQVRGSAVFSSIAPVPADVAAIDAFAESTVEECLQLHDAVDSVGIGREWQFLVGLSKARLLVLKHRRDDAVGLLEDLQKQYDDLLGGDEPNPSQARFDRLLAQASG